MVLNMHPVFKSQCCNKVIQFSVDDSLLDSSFCYIYMFYLVQNQCVIGTANLEGC